MLFALLDAAEDEGRMRHAPAAQQQWWEVKTRLNVSDFEAEGGLLWELVDELDRSRAFAGSWIQDRWHTVKMQVVRAKALTQNPFVY